METTSHKGPQASEIKKMFSSIAGGYDQANTFLSAGIHHLWRKALVSYSNAQVGDRVLDCATGTGDLAIEFRRTVGPQGRVTGTDFCAEMLALAPAKARSHGFTIDFQLADVMALPFNENLFDIASISFGIRNVENPSQAISELYRVLKPRGSLYILEFGQPKSKVVAHLYNSYSTKVLPKIGGWITGQPQAYSYLEKSASKFPCREEFVELIKNAAPFKSVEFKSLSLGVAYIYKTTK